MRTDFIIFDAKEQTDQDLFFKYEKNLEHDENNLHPLIKPLTWSSMRGSFFHNPFDYVELDYLRAFVDRLKIALNRNDLAWMDDSFDPTDFLEYDNKILDDYDGHTMIIRVRITKFQKVLGRPKAERKDALREAKNAKKRKAVK